MSFRELQRMPDGHLHLYVFDVGQGDSIFLVTPSGKQILVDAGPDLIALTRLAEVMPALDHSIDLLILSHPHLDHLAAFPQIIDRYDIGAVMLSGLRYNGSAYESMLAKMRQKSIRIFLPDPKQDLDLGDGVVLDILGPGTQWFGKSGSDDDVNNTSVVLRVLYKEQSILLTGDMEEKQENAVLASGQDINSTVLKVAHHGSKTSTSTGFLLAASPDLALISAGRGNKFKHPNLSTLIRLKHFGIPYRVTAEEGTIHLSW